MIKPKGVFVVFRRRSACPQKTSCSSTAFSTKKSNSPCGRTSSLVWSVV